jgi:S1-C subfamily serine protease
VAGIAKRYEFDDRPRLGITIGDDEAGPTEGVSVMGVSPGGAADEAGLHSGDLITAINGESLAAGNAGEANRKLLDFMSGVEAGDVLKIDYLRKGKEGTVELAPKSMNGPVFAFGGPDFEMHVPVAPGSPSHPLQTWAWISGSGGFADMELVTLTERLGRYFGTDKGLLVVRAPEDDKLKLEDGDVIQRIDGREPTSVSHAMRILGSYQSGEKFAIEIMRDKKRQTLSVEMPDNRQSRAMESVVPRLAPARAAAPATPAAPLPAVPSTPADST